MGKSSAPPSELLEAARRLEEVLEHFAKLARAIEKEPLSSRKSLDRAGTSLAKIADTEEELPVAMSGLMSALNALRQRHEEQTEAVKRRAEEIRERSEIYRGLLERLRALVEDAARINARMSELAASEKGKDELAADLDVVLGELGALGDATDALEHESKELRFEDLGREADGLSTQLGTAKSKLARLKKDLSR
jgi:chromosome segregation ATPase